MRLKRTSKMEPIYGIDLGGTNVSIGKVDPKTGEIIGNLKIKSVDSVKSNQDLTELVSSELDEEKEIAICAAGDVDEEKLIIRHSPNIDIDGEVTLAKDLKERGYQVTLTNDMKAAVQSIAHYGKGNGYKNVCVATYSSGFNCAVARDKRNVTEAEMGHMVYRSSSSLFCGCGQPGHLEPFVSGNGASAMAKQYFIINSITEHPIIRYVLPDYNERYNKNYELEDLKEKQVYHHLVSKISAKHVYRAYKNFPKQEPQKRIHKTQVNAIADSFGKIVSAFNPLDIIVCIGGQTKDKDVLFNPAIEKYRKDGKQLDSLNKPKIVIDQRPEIGVQGAVGYLIQKRENGSKNNLVS